jgi:hypothetical protein
VALAACAGFYHMYSTMPEHLLLADMRGWLARADALRANR